MSEIVNEATIRVTADASGVETGLRPVEAAVARTGKNLENLGATAQKTAKVLEDVGRGSGFENVGDGAGTAAARVDRATQNMAASIQRATQATEALSAGAKGTAANFAALASSKGLNADVLKPYLAQLEEAQRKTELITAANRRLDESTKFLSDLKSRTESIGKSASELASLRAAQLGVSESAAPMIAKMREAEEASKSSASAFEKSEEKLSEFKGVLLGLGAAAAAGAFSALIHDTIDDLAELDDMAQKTGASVENLSKIQKVVSVFGPDMASVDGALNKLAKGMATVDDESNKTHKALSALGVSWKDSAGNLRDPALVLVDVAKKLQNYNDGAAKTALITDAIGKSGAELLPFLNDLAENYDKVASVSADAAGSAANLQDQFGWMKLHTKELYTAIAVEMLPSLNDLAGAFLDASKEQKSLIDGGGVQWADDIALGIARVADVVALIPRAFGAVSGSFKVVGADLKVLSAAAEAANPITAAKKVLAGGNPLADFNKVVDERNKILADANAKYEELWNKPANQFEQAFIKRLNERASQATAPAGPQVKERGNLAYEAGNDPAAKEAEAAAKAAKKAYDDLIIGVKEKIAVAKGEADMGIAVSESQKLQISLDEKLAVGKLKLTKQQKDEYQSLIQVLSATEGVMAMRKAEEDWLKIRKEYQDGADKSINAAIQEAEKNDELAASYGKTKSAIADLEVARLEEQLAQRGAGAFTLDEIENLEKLIAAKKRNAAALTKLDNLGDAKKATDELDKFLDPSKPQTFGEALRTAFGSAGESITKLTGSLQDFGIKQAEIAKQRQNAEDEYKKGGGSYATYLERIDQLNQRNTKNQLAGYGDMAGAAAGFFNEHSRGYQSLMMVSQVFHAAELAMTTAELVPKGISAVLSQGQGDPYTAFGRMAAMAAIVAGLGVAIGGIGGGGGVSAADRQKTQGTGSVLGDSDAKSESIKRSLEAIEKNTFQDLAINSSMLATLRSIDSNISSFASQLVRSTDITNPDVSLTSGVSGANKGTAALAAVGYTAGSMVTLIGSVMGPLGALAGVVLSKIPVISKAMTSIFGGKQSVEDSGFTMDAASLATIMGSGAKAFQYADIKTSGGWFKGDKHSEQMTALGDAANQQFTAIIESLADSVKSAGTLLGLSGDDFTNKLNSFVVDIGKVSLKDLKGDELQKALESVFSKLGDDMAQFAVGGLGQFQQVGEGYLETLVRIASEYQTIDVVFQSFGKTFGAVGLASIGARDRLVQLAGGLEEFTSQGEYFLQNFFSEQEQAAALKARIDPTLGQYGLSTEGAEASKAFRDFIVGLDTTTEAGAKAYSALMAIAPAFKAVTDAQKDALDERKDLQDQLDELTMSSTQLLAKQRDALDESNRALFDQIQAIKSIKDAASSLLGGVDDAFSVLQKVVAREKEVLQKRIDSETEAVNRLKSLTDTISSTLDNMKVPGADVIGRQTAQAQIKDALAAVQGGAQLSDDQIKSLGKALSTVSQDSSKQFGSKEDYLFDFLTTRNDIAQLGDVTGDQLSAEEQSLEELKDQSKALDDMLAKYQEQIDVLKGIGTTGLSIEQALYGLQSSILEAQKNSVIAATAAITKAYQDALGRAPDSAGMQFWQNQAAAGTSIGSITGSIKNSSEAQIQQLYQSLLGRSADASGMSFYLGSGASLSDIAKAIKDSDEYKKLHPFAVGTNDVPTDMAALIHKGERIIPAADNRELMRRLASPQGNSEALATALAAMTATANKQQGVIEAMAKRIESMERVLSGVSPNGSTLRVKVVN